VLSGSRSANPWLELDDPQMNFLIENDYARNMTVVRNRHPRKGEPNEFNGDSPPTPVTYAVLAFLPGIESSRNVPISKTLRSQGRSPSTISSRTKKSLVRSSINSKAPMEASNTSRCS
jgi:hypothetical protein